MTAKLQAMPVHILDEDFEPENLHPADIEQILIAGFEEYESIPSHGRLRKLYRNAYNKLVDCITEKRGFKQFSYI